MNEDVQVIEPNEQQNTLPSPVLEEIIHGSAIEVRKVPVNISETEVAMMTLLRFHTPFKVFTIKLDDNGVNALVMGLREQERGSDIVIARPGDIPGLRR